MTLATVPLLQLRPGHEAFDNINARAGDRELGIPELAASIVEEKLRLLQPLLVVERDGLFYVLDGNRRLEALRLLASRGAIADDYLADVALTPDGTPAELLARSLAANELRVPLHPVDRFHAFARCVDEGMTQADIAARFSFSEKAVRQSLALGALAPEIREAWRRGEVDGEAAKAFTLAPSPADQLRVFRKLTKGGGRATGWNVKEHFTGRDQELGSMIAFVGLDAIRSAGVDIREDLFGNNHAAEKPAEIKRLAEAKLDEVKERLLAEGWAWASTDAEVGDQLWQFGTLPQPRDPKPTRAEQKRLKELEAIYETSGVDDPDADPSDEDHDAADRAAGEAEAIRAEIKKRAYSTEQKASSGCVLSIGHDGSLRISYGRTKPAEKRKAAAVTKAAEREKAGKAAGVDAGAAISGALAQRLSEQLTRAIGKALAGNGELALAALLAGFAAQGSWGSKQPVSVSHDGLIAKLDRRGAAPSSSGTGTPFETVFASFVEMTLDQKLTALSELVGKTLDLQVFNADTLPLGKPGNAALCSAVPVDRMSEALAEVFDVDDYFKSASAKIAEKALDDMGRAKPKGGKKPELAAAAIEGAKETGWLPPELRTVHYAGPGARKHKAAKPKGKAAAKPKAPKRTRKPARSSSPIDSVEA